MSGREDFYGTVSVIMRTIHRSVSGPGLHASRKVPMRDGDLFNAMRPGDAQGSLSGPKNTQNRLARIHVVFQWHLTSSQFDNFTLTHAEAIQAINTRKVRPLSREFNQEDNVQSKDFSILLYHIGFHAILKLYSQRDIPFRRASAYPPTVRQLTLPTVAIRSHDSNCNNRNHSRSVPPTMATWAAIARKAAETTAEALEEGVKFSWAENEANKVTAATLKEFGPPLSYDTDSDNGCESKVKTELNAGHNNNNIIMAAQENIVIAPEVPMQNTAGTSPGPASDEGASSSSAAPSVGAPISRVEEFKLALGDFGTQLGLMVRLKGVAPENVDECVNNIIEKSLDDIIAVKGKDAQKNKKVQRSDAANNKKITAPTQQPENDPKNKGKAVETTDAFTGMMEGYKFSAASQLPPTDTADVIMFFTKPDAVTGETEIPVHRELLIRESTWFSRPGGLPPPNKDGKPVYICLGEGPAGVVGQVFRFLYNHKVDECERNAGSPFHLIHIQCNVNQYVLAVAYGMTRQQQYHLNKVQEHVEWLREHVSHNAPLCNMVLTTGVEIGWCEVPLRHCNTCLWKEVIPAYREVCAGCTFSLPGSISSSCRG
ncbi:predicted protein [Verticillium alfalfae VaMs.102]|uniref:Predicted protein n=1 Tax=Verticillium alfalfae (strain VaMs.102 / ATCC MYA-4576 / FGSC 10136) TaxID=526221 RepID=C9SIW5_VERA1|nr:predicted protein [Verticillium alfalfae VaMs.102]EEY18888.1 predicted protein [Verticillium alfalfae VaMs.102]